MPRDRSRQTQTRGGPFLTDGWLETSRIFHGGTDRPHFAAFTMLRDGPGRETLRRYVRPYLDLAARHRIGFAWRARPGGRAATGAPGSATTRRRRSPPTAT